MKVMKAYSLLAFLSLVIASGCDRRPADEVVASVNGTVYTKSELERDVSIVEKLQSLAGYQSIDRADAAAQADYRRRVVNGFVVREILLEEAARRHIDLSPAEMRVFQDEFAAGFSGQVPMNFDAMLEVLGSQATAFRNNLKKDALSAKAERILKEQIAASLPETPKSDLERMRREALEFNRGLEAANRSLARLATNSWKSIRAGNDFAVVGQALVKMQKGIAFEPVFRDAEGRYSALAVGKVSALTPVEGGLEFAKANGDAAFSRIVFRWQKPREVPSDGKAAREKAVQDAYARKIGELKQAARIEINL